MLSVSNYEYSQGDLLGHGAFALVFKGRRKRDHVQVAIKQISLKSVPGKLSSIRQKEITILKELKNVNIVQLYDYLETPKEIFLVMEYCNGGDLGDYLISKKTLSEGSIRHLCNHIVNALKALAALRIIHRDIKPQNLLLSYPASFPSPSPSSSYSSIKAAFTEATIKLADFGFARYLTEAEMAATLCGSPLYMAPEILMNQQYNSSVDLWSVGAILFQCLSGKAPFLASNIHELRRKYHREKLIPKIPEGTSHYLSDLLTRLLKKNSKERLTYTDLFSHNFLKTPSSLSSDPMLSFRPSQVVKSSPVPIKRKPHPSHSSPSPQQHHQHHQHHHSHQHSSSGAPTSHGSHGSSVDASFSPSSSSGPPLSHRVGSQASLPYYSAQSPSSEVTDQGFILVDFPGGPGSRRCSVSSSGGGGCHGSGRSSGRNSLPNHTPSSASGSLSRYVSLTTPFYQPPPTSQSGSRQGPSLASPVVPRGCGGMEGTTPVNRSPKVGSSGTNPYHHKGLVPYQTSPSSGGPVPFGNLIQPLHPMGYSPASATNFSNLSSNSGGSQHRGSTYHTSPIASPPLPPASSASPLGTHYVHYAAPVNTKGNLSRRNSGTKLSALAEERERRGSKKRTKNTRGSGTKGGETTTKTEKTSSGGFDIITQSCLLGFSGDEGGSSEGDFEDLDDGNFPLNLSMSLTDQEEDNEGEESRSQSHSHNSESTMSINTVQIVGSDVVRYMPSQPRPVSTGGKREEATTGSGRPKRTASFSHAQRNSQLSQELAALHTKASSLSAHGDPFAPGFSSAASLPPSSPSAEIVAFKLPFTFSDSTDGGQEQPGGGHTLIPGPPTVDDDNVKFGSLRLGHMKDSLELAKEMYAMAKARQGPILLLSISADLNDSGVAGRWQRCCEQLVLYVKAFSLLDALSTSYGLELALTSNHEPPQKMKKIVEEAAALQKSCLQEAKDIRQELLSQKKSSNGLAKVSAERLLFLEGLDMCKAALLDEKSVDKMECIKRYKRAKIIFKYLLVESKSQRDKLILQKYIESAQARVNHLLQ